jgi:hypothetical protein
MIRVLSAYSREPDDPERAARDILSQLDMENRLLKNSAGLLFCHVDFIDFGVAEALCDRLPFEIAGGSSQCFAVPGAEDEIMLSLTVFTSDDVEFAAGISEPLLEDTEKRVDAAYRKAAAALPSPPALVFAVEPTLINLGGDVITRALDRACGGAPIFGTSAMDADTKLRNPKTFYRGKAYPDRLALLLMAGPVKPRFFSARYPDKAVFVQGATITASRDNMILSINNMPAVAYLEKTGLVHHGAYEVLFVIPLLVDYGNGTEQDIVVMIDIDRNGALLCSREVRAGGTLNIGSTTAGYVLESAKALARSVRDDREHAALFMFSCFSRSVPLGDPLAETRIIREELAGFPVPYTFCYSGGEICPEYTGPDTTANRFHQYALVACLI